MNKKITDVKSNDKKEIYFTYDKKNYMLIESEYAKVLNQPKKNVYCLNGPSRVDLVKFGMPIHEVAGYDALSIALKSVMSS